MAVTSLIGYFLHKHFCQLGIILLIKHGVKLYNRGGRVGVCVGRNVKISLSVKKC